MDVAFLGLGQMGSGMAGQLIEAGHRVTVWNRDAGKTASFERRGAAVAANPAAAAGAGTVMTMLANDEAVEAVAFGEAGILSAASSTSPAAPSASPSPSDWRRPMRVPASASCRPRCSAAPMSARPANCP